MKSPLSQCRHCGYIVHIRDPIWTLQHIVACCDTYKTDWKEIGGGFSRSLCYHWWVLYSRPRFSHNTLYLYKKRGGGTFYQPLSYTPFSLTIADIFRLMGVPRGCRE